MRNWICTRCGARESLPFWPDCCSMCGDLVVPDGWSFFDDPCPVGQADAGDAAEDRMERTLDEIGAPFIPGWIMAAAASLVIWSLLWLYSGEEAMARCQEVSSFDACHYALNR